MLDFVFILLIFLEIILSAICVVQLIKIEKKVIAYNQNLIILGERVLEVNKIIRDTIKKINKVISIFSNRKFILIRKILRYTLNTIQIILFLKSLNLSKGLKSINYKTIKKILYAEIARKILVKILDIIKDLNLNCTREVNE